MISLGENSKPTQIFLVTLGAALQNAMIDPIVSPGVPSSYAQAIFGGDAFSNTMTHEDT